MVSYRVAEVAFLPQVVQPFFDVSRVVRNLCVLMFLNVFDIMRKALLSPQFENFALTATRRHATKNAVSGNEAWRKTSVATQTVSHAL